MGDIRVTRHRGTVADAVRKLERHIRQMERRYECASDRAIEAVRTGEMKETADIALWLTKYQELVHLRKVLDEDRATGTPGKTSRRSS